MTLYIALCPKSDPILQREGTWNAKLTTTATTMTGEQEDFGGVMYDGEMLWISGEDMG